MPMGAISAVDAMFPGPIEDNAAVSRNTIIGMTPAFPRQERTARYAMRSSVPFTCACANSSVTPTSVRNRVAGKPAITCSGRMPPA